MLDDSRLDEPRETSRFHTWCERVVDRLPFNLRRVVAPTFVGFCLINGLTFGVDMAILTGLRGGVGLPVPVAVTCAYACAFALSYLLNRTFNFHSHAPVGPQVAIYVAVVTVNYFAFILGVSTALTAWGVQYQLSRMVAGACEAAFMYCAMRWLVFRSQASDR